MIQLLLPLDEVIYVDVDVILFRDLRPVFGALQPGRADFIIASPSFEYVYNNKRDRYPYLKDARLFNDGFFVGGWFRTVDGGVIVNSVLYLASPTDTSNQQPLGTPLAGSTDANWRLNYTGRDGADVPR